MPAWTRCNRTFTLWETIVLTEHPGPQVADDRIDRLIADDQRPSPGCAKGEESARLKPTTAASPPTRSPAGGRSASPCHYNGFPLVSHGGGAVWPAIESA
jgi:hypothetical protein